ncbi:Ribonuclease III domain-containing protein RNC1, chloroplastic [Glycine max]|nr:Ribonuclease III domain-containing protein RNC1, chloroplastic [Glycine max]
MVSNPKSHFHSNVHTSPMELSSSFTHSHNLFSFSSSLTPTLRRQTLRVSAVTIDPPQELPKNSPQRLLKELAERKRPSPRTPRAPPRRFILTRPLDDKRVADRFLNSPQLALNTFPLLSSCLPFSPLDHLDKSWMENHLMEAKQALGYPLEPSLTLGDDSGPAMELDTLLYLAFQHESCERSRARHVRFGHSRLFFLGQYVLELALAEYFLQRYPRESPAPMRERVFELIGKRSLPRWIKGAALHNLVFPYDDMDKLVRKEREATVKSVFWALFGAIYLCFGMPEVYRVLFEVFGMDPDAEDCQPKLRRQLEDIDHVSAEFEGKISWQDMVVYKARSSYALFAHPRLFRACVPPGMHRFRGNLWDYDCRPQIMRVLGYPLKMTDRIPEITKARNIELDLGLQLCFLHPSKYKFDHPRFCYERLEYLGQKIQDLVMAERLLMKHLDAPGLWLQNRHRRFLMNKYCGRYLRAKNLHHFIIYNEKVQDAYQRAYRLKYPVTTSVQQALHGLSYAVYGKRDVRRLMFEVFDFEQTQPEAM